MVAELTTNDYLIEDLTYDWREGIGEGERLREIRREGDTEGGRYGGREIRREGDTEGGRYVGFVEHRIRGE